jgi:uncharacterized membrane protein YdbT with pleckstrin-like domain
MTPPDRQEVDVWWGSYSIKSVLPGLLASLAASGLAVATAWLLPHGSLEQLFALGLLGLCWVALLLFWAYRVFGVNYRLTTHRLFVETGLRHRRLQAVELSKISQVAFKRTSLEEFLGTGRLFVDVQGSAAPLVLRGVLGAENIAEKIGSLREEAREHAVG